MILSDSTVDTDPLASGQSLTIGTGGLILNGTDSSSNKTISGSGTLTAGSAGGYELIVHTTGTASSTPHTISATIADNGANSVTFTKSGVLNLMLSGNNTYTGPTYVAQGTLSLSNATNNIASSSSIVVAGGATLNVAGISGGFKLGTNQSLRGSGNIVGTFTADASGSTVAPGNSPGQLTFSGVGNITLGAGSISLNPTVEMQFGGNGGSDIGTAGVDYDQIVIGSGKTLTLNGPTLKILPLQGIVSGQPYTIVSATNAITYSSLFRNLDGTSMADGTTYTQGAEQFQLNYGSNFVSITFTTVPEPSSVGLILLAAPAILRRRRRTR